jgi:hypothetical protein
MSVPSHPPARRRRWWQRWSVRLVALARAGVAAFLLSRLSDGRLRLVLSRLDRDDPGWRFDDLLAARAAVPDAENSAPVVASARDLLPPGWPPPGLEVFDELAKRPANERPSPEDYARLSNSLSEWEPALAESRTLVNLPRGRHPINTKRPYVLNLAVPHHQTCREVADLLRCAALRRACEGDADGALADCRAAFNAGRSIGDEPLAMSQVNRIKCVCLACDTAMQVLAQGTPSPDATLALRQLLEDEDSFLESQLATRGERAFHHEIMTDIETGAVSLSLFTGGPPSRTAGLMQSLLTPSLKTDHANNLSYLTRFAETTRLPLHEQAAAEAALTAEMRSARLWTTAPNMMPAVAFWTENGRRKHAYLRCLIVGLAAERYRVRHGVWPAAANDLVPNELSAVPLDPYDGQSIRFLPVADGVVVYSVGPNAVDDGGKLGSGTWSGKPGLDYGYHFWNPDQRGRPAPAEGAKP